VRTMWTEHSARRLCGRRWTGLAIHSIRHFVCGVSSTVLHCGAIQGAHVSTGVMAMMHSASKSAHLLLAIQSDFWTAVCVHSC